VPAGGEQPCSDGAKTFSLLIQLQLTNARENLESSCLPRCALDNKNQSRSDVRERLRQTAHAPKSTQPMDEKEVKENALSPGKMLQITPRA